MKLNKIKTYPSFQKPRFFIRRPLALFCLMAITLITLCHRNAPEGGAFLQDADGRFLTVTGQIVSRETTASGYRLLLQQVTFPEKEGQGSKAYNRVRDRIAESWPPSGRITVFLNGPGGRSAVSSYGEGKEKQLWVSREKMVDQSDFYEKARIGLRLTFYGKCSIPAPATNPGQFDARRYNRSRDIYMMFSDVRLRRIAPGKGPLSLPPVSAYLNGLADLRYGLKRSSLKVFGDRYSSLIDAIVLGDRSGLDPETRSLFEDGGILHILAVSSLHVTLLGMALYRLLRKLRRSFAFSALFSGLLVVSYCLMTGNSFSAVRAAVMFLFWLLSQIFGRTSDRLTSLAAAALLILARHPYAISDTGFLLSFGCILSIELLSPVFSTVFRPKEGILKNLTGSAALQAGILPLSLWFFYQMTPWAILLNLIVIPSMSLFMAFGVIGCLAGLPALLTASAPALSGLLLTCARLLSGPCGRLLDLFCFLCRAARMLPGDVIVTGRPAVWKLVIYYAVLGGFCIYVSLLDRHSLKMQRRYLPAAAAVLLLLLIILLTVHRPVHFRYTCLDIGQGSCNLVETDGSTILFDGGSSSVTDVWQYRIESTVKYYGISKIDLVFLSHGDIDHIDGIGQMLEGYHAALGADNSGGVSIGRILIPDLRQNPEEMSGLTDIISSAAAAGIPVTAVSEGTEVRTDSLTLQVLSPSEDRMTGESNQDCIVLFLTCGRIRILFTGDLEKEGEEKFLAFCRKARIFSSPEDTQNILIAGHHGSRYATSDDLLRLYRPDLVLISCGKNNRYGHPAPSMLKRLAIRHVPYVRTDQTGAFILNTG